MTKKPTGLTLLDIGKISETVKIGNTEIKVCGVSAKGVLALFVRFPELQKYYSGDRLSAPEMLKVAPDAIAAVIAAGTGEPGDEMAEEIASRLNVEAQLDILEAIGRVTFRGGFGPFVQRITALAAAVGIGSARSGKDQLTNSLQPSKPSSPPAMTTEASGATPPAE